MVAQVPRETMSILVLLGTIAKAQVTVEVRRVVLVQPLPVPVEVTVEVAAVVAEEAVEEVEADRVRFLIIIVFWSFSNLDFKGQSLSVIIDWFDFINLN